MRIVIAGAGFAGRRLIAGLTANRHDVIAIDLNRDICELVSSRLGVVALCGNATDITVLEEAEIGRAEVAVALLRQSADNLSFSLLAKGAGADRIIARMRNPKYRQAYEQAGATGVIDVAGLFLDQLLLEIEHPQIHQLATFASGKGIIVFLKVPQTSRAAGKTIEEITADRRFPEACVIAGLVRAEGNRLVVPPDSERLRADDQLVLCGTVKAVAEAADYFQIKPTLLSFAPFRKAARPDLLEQQAQLEMDAAVEEKTESEGDSLGA